MKRKHGLIALMLASSLTVGFTTMAGCSDGKTEEEKNCEEKIRQLLEYDANIDISRDTVEEYGFVVANNITDNNEYLITFKTRHRGSWNPEIRDIITYSVDKDFYYNFKNTYSTTETQKEVDMITELTSIYDPIRIVVNGEEQTL